MTPDTVAFTLNGRPVSAPAGGSLLDALRDTLGVRSTKDGCSPQGQCGCCTVWIDDQPRVACVTQLARVAGRRVTTLEGLVDADEWASTFTRAGASQCGFCTPGIIMRCAALDIDRRAQASEVRRAMLAHLCRCTGWQSVVEAVASFGSATVVERDWSAAELRATLEGGVPQSVGPDVALGNGGFADDGAPPDALAAVRGLDDTWVVAATLDEARTHSGQVQGRRTTADLTWPIEVPPGNWVRTLRTTWVEPAYLEPDASWCVPGGRPASSLGNGGAFGGKTSGGLGAVARELADAHGVAVRVVSTREDVVRDGPKRPPIAAGIRADGTGIVQVVRTPGIADAITAQAPGLEVHEVEVVGPSTSVALRGAGWVEAAVLLASLQDGPRYTVTSPHGAVASAELDDDGTIDIVLRCGTPLDEVVLRSYCIGAAHMALGWVRSEGLALDARGVPADLTIRSFGVVRAVDTPHVRVEIVDDDGPPVNGSDAVFAAVATAVWAASGWHERWPINR